MSCPRALQNVAPTSPLWYNTKGKLATFEGREVFCVLISSKRSTDD